LIVCGLAHRCDPESVHDKSELTLVRSNERRDGAMEAAAEDFLRVNDGTHGGNVRWFADSGYRRAQPA